MNIRTFVGSSLVVMTGLVLFPMTVQAQTINDRRENQHDRIQQGVKSGELTHHEAQNLRERESNIHAREHRDRIANGGNLTNKERVRLNQSLNHTSQAIYRDKHNDFVR